MFHCVDGPDFTHLAVEQYSHMNKFGISFPATAGLCEVTACIGSKGRCFSVPLLQLSHTGQATSGTGAWAVVSAGLLLFPLQFVSSFRKTELEASSTGCTVLGYR